MAKVIITALLILAVLLPGKVSAAAIKFGYNFASGSVEGHKLSFKSPAFKLEGNISKRFGLGLGFRKEDKFGLWGSYAALYASYTRPLAFKNKVHISCNGGMEFGLPSPAYNQSDFEYDALGQLTRRKQISLDPMFRNRTGIGVFPFSTVFAGYTFKKRLILEAGLKIQLLRFGIWENRFNPDTGAILTRKCSRRIVFLPSLTLQTGYRF